MRPLVPILLTTWLALTLSACQSAGPSKDDTEPCFASDRLWVEDHRDRLPQDLDALNQLAPEHQWAVAAFGPPELRSLLWREHLQRQLQVEGQTADQIAALEDLRDQLSPELFAAVDQGKASEDLAALRGLDLVTLFGAERAREISLTLGDASTAAVLGERNAQGDRRIEECECSVGSAKDECFSVLDCRNIEKCEKSFTGCGNFFLFACDGLCKPFKVHDDEDKP
ncbi:MAG: bacteriocin fulvocin C-related protein [Acidobacteriota bacterium]